MKNFTRQTLFLTLAVLLASSLWAQESNRIVVKKVIHKDGATTIEEEVTETKGLLYKLKDLQAVDGEGVEVHLSAKDIELDREDGETLIVVRKAKTRQHEENAEPKEVRVFWHGNENEVDQEERTVIINSNDPARPILGIYVDEDADVEGIKISSITEGKGAEKAGIQEDDIITEVDGNAIRSVRDLRSALASHQAGDPVQVQYNRGSRTAVADVMLSEEESYSYSYTYDYDYDHSHSARRNPCEVFIGVGTHTVDNGVKVDYTIDDTPARLYGVQEDDVILALNGVPVNSQSKLEYERDKNDPGDAFTLTIERNGQRMDIDARFKECDEETLQEIQEEKLTELLEDIEDMEQRNVQVRPILGIYPSDNASLEGLKISSLVSGKGAEIAGLKGGDIITQVDGKVVRSTSDLRNALAGHQPGDKVTVSYKHYDETRQADVILSASQNHYSYTVQRDPCKPFIGVYTSGRSEGVRVNGVIEDTPAKFSGVLPNDVILALDGAAVNSQYELKTERDKHQAGDPFILTIQRGDENFQINATFKSCDENVDEEEVEEVVEMAVEDETPIDETQDLDLSGTLKVESFNLFPNPAVSKINVLFQSAAAPTTVQIFDASGKAVFTDQKSTFDGYYNEQIDLTGQTPGNYILTVRQNGKVLSKQFVLIPRV